MTRAQLRSAIEGPVRVGGGAIASRLVQRLLKHVGDDPDQLPVLQHALMRTWDCWARAAGPSGPMDLPHYESTGGMAEALSRHGDEVYEGLADDHHRKLAERLFQALTEKASDNRGIRRPTSLASLLAITEAGAGTLQAGIEDFRKSGRTFLMPPQEVELRPETVIDISHESLMRVWKRLKHWVEQEAESAAICRFSSSLRVVLRGHTGAVNTAEFSSNGESAVTASEDGTARIWNVRTGKSMATLQGHEANVHTACFSPDGQLVVTASDDATARVWDVRTGKTVAIFESHTEAVVASNDPPKDANPSESHPARFSSRRGHRDLRSLEMRHGCRLLCRLGQTRSPRLWFRNGRPQNRLLRFHNLQRRNRLASLWHPWK